MRQPNHPHLVVRPPRWPVAGLVLAMLLLAACASFDNDHSPPSDYQGETAQARLIDFQNDLNTVLDNLRKVPASPQAKFVEDAIADLTQTQAATVQALEYVQAHPESDWLPAIPAREGYPPIHNFFRSGYFFEAPIQSAYPTLEAEVGAMGESIGKLIDGPYPASAILGNLDGHRDDILRHLYQAADRIITEAKISYRAAHPNPQRDANPNEVAPTPAIFADSSVPFGSISGSVEDGDGKAANVLISFQRVGTATQSPYGSGAPATITDENGGFTIKNLPPGIYYIYANRVFLGGFAQFSEMRNVEVTDGPESHMDHPIMLRDEY